MAELRSDPKNANRGTVRGRGMLERSLSQYGAGRAPVASADGVILAGNKTVEVARELGILVFTLPGVMPDKPPRGWYAVPGGDWVCDRHSMNVEAMGPSDADYPAVIEVPE